MFDELGFILEIVSFYLIATVERKKLGYVLGAIGSLFLVIHFASFGLAQLPAILFNIFWIIICVIGYKK